MPEDTEQAQSPVDADDAVEQESSPVDDNAADVKSDAQSKDSPRQDEGRGDSHNVDITGEQGQFGELSEVEIADLKANETAYTWQASEYAHHHKSGMWYLSLFAALVILIIILVLMHSWLEIGLFIVMGVAIVIYGGRAPRTLVYELSPTGITVDGKFYDFKVFRAFSVLEETDWHVIDLEPTKRFAVRLSVLFDSANLDEIVGHLSLHLVRSDRQPDVIEKLARYLRF
jgi:hypothetical protein